MTTLIQQLLNCETLLRSVEEIFWADKIKNILLKGNKNIDISMLSDIISWYGGMGSFNDLIISEYNDHILNGQNEEKLNDDLNEIRSSIYQEAIRLRKP